MIRLNKAMRPYMKNLVYLIYNQLGQFSDYQ